MKELYILSSSVNMLKNSVTNSGCYNQTVLTPFFGELTERENMYSVPLETQVPSLFSHFLSTTLCLYGLAK
jgi:hypothetical protein